MRERPQVQAAKPQWSWKDVLMVELQLVFIRQAFGIRKR